MRTCHIHFIELENGECRFCVREDNLTDLAFNNGIEAVCALTDSYKRDFHCTGHTDDPCCHVRTALSIGEKGRALKKAARSGHVNHTVFNCPVCGTAKCQLPERTVV